MISKYFRLLFFFLIACNTAGAQKNYLFTTAASNISGNFAVIDLAELNGKPNAVFSVRTNAASASANPHAIGVWYTGTKWSIFNQDKVAMPSGVTFLISISDKAIVQKSDEANTRNHQMLIDAAPLNGNASAKITVTQNWNPGNNGGVYNNSDVELNYNEGQGKWMVTNKNNSPIPAGAAFNIVELIDAAPQDIPGAGGRPAPPAPGNGGGNNQELVVITAERPASDPAIYNFLTNNQGPTYPSTKVTQPVGGGEIKGSGTKEQDYKLINYTAENLVFNPQTDALYAGSIIQSKPFFENTLFTPLNKQTKPGTITMVGGNGPGNGSRSVALRANTLAAYQDAVNQIITGINLQNSVGSNEFRFNSCRTAEQGLVEAKVNVRTTNFRARGDFSYEYSFDKSVAVGVLTQKYYSINYTPPSDKQNLFAPGTTLAELQREGLVSNDNRPAYVSQIDYGRIFIIIAESEASQSELHAFLQANYNGATTQVDAQAKFEQMKRNNQLSIKILSVGSNNNADELNDISPDAFKTFLRNGATASVQNPGAIIGYRVRDLISNRDIPTMLTADYSELEWDGVTVDNVEYTVKPGGCADCVQNGVWNRTTTGTQLTLKKGDVISFETSGRATHGPWLWFEAKGPEGQPGERTKPSDKLQCPNEKNECDCNRFAIIANIPQSSGKMWTCVAGGISDFVVPKNMPQPLGFTFNDDKTDDGEGSFLVKVKRIPYHTVIKRR